MSSTSAETAQSVTPLRVVVMVMLALFILVELALIASFAYAQQGRPRAALIVGGMEGDPFSSIVRRGGRAAAADLDWQLDAPAMRWADDDVLKAIRDAIDTSDTGIALVGHPGEVALSSLVDQALRRQLAVTSLNVDLPRLQRQHEPEGFGYVGADQNAAGITMGRACLERLRLPAGSAVAMVATYFGPASSRQRRPDAAIRILREGGMRIVTERMPAEWYHHGDHPTRANITDLVATWRRDHPDLRLVVCDAMQVLPDLIWALAGWRAQQSIEVVTFDLSESTAKLIDDGQVAFTIDQQAFLQGYLPLIQLRLARRVGVPGLVIDCGSAVVGKQELPALRPLIREGIR